MKDLIQKYNFKIEAEAADNHLKEIIAKCQSNMNSRSLELCLSCIDLTSLHTSDTEAFIEEFTNKVNGFKAAWANLPLPASICVYPNFAKVVKRTLKEREVGITTVAGCFPSSQSFLGVKILETTLAVVNGATEIDIVLPHNSFLAKDYQKCKDEICALRKATEGKKLKVILESGVFEKEAGSRQEAAELIAEASLLALECGADFIKTSTGKQEPAATPFAAYIMCSALKAYQSKTGQRRGFKPAGGISTSEDAIVYYTIVKELLGEEQLTPQLFRIGASSLANNILSSLKGEKVKYY